MSRILIVEDDPAISCGLRDNLLFDQHQVFTAADGEEGYQLLQRHAPDLVILDWMLPKLAGVDLCRRVRAEGFGSPILMLSARGQEADRVMGLDVGANDYVSKPFSLKELLARVRALLRHEREHHQDEERLNAELHAAAKVQHDLFPRVLPEIQGLDYAGLCLPARGVSGDCYDFFLVGQEIPGKARLGILLADVCGKGMSAALLGATLQGAVRSHASAPGSSCADVLAKANELLFETTASNRFATAFYAVYDANTRVLTYANAGHCPPMLLRRGVCTRLDSTMPPLGILAGLLGAEEQLELAPGDCLLFTSDGIPEAANEQGEEFGDEQLQQAFRAALPDTAAQLCGGIVRRTQGFIGKQSQADDITLIVLKVQ